MGTHRIVDWPSAPDAMAPELKSEFAAHGGDGRVGNVLLSETERVRVWGISLKPGERPGFHTRVLDYFWTSVTGGPTTIAQLKPRRVPMGDRAFHNVVTAPSAGRRAHLTPEDARQVRLVSEATG